MNNLVQMIDLSRSVAKKQAMENDMMSGNDIFIDSNSMPADKFICKDHDDAKLLSYVSSLDEKTCCLWHALRISEGGIMWHIILSVIANSNGPQ